MLISKYYQARDQHCSPADLIMPNVKSDRIRAAVNEVVQHIGFADWLGILAKLAGAEMKKKVG